MKKACSPRRRLRSPANMKLATGSSAKARTSMATREGTSAATAGAPSAGRFRDPRADGSARHPEHGRRSVHGRVLREPRDEGQRSSLTAEDPAPQALRIGGDRVGGPGGDDVPRALLDLRLELSRVPTGIAGEQRAPTNEPPAGPGSAARSTVPTGRSPSTSTRQPAGRSGDPSSAASRELSRTRPIRALRATGPPVNSSAGGGGPLLPLRAATPPRPRRRGGRAPPRGRRGRRGRGPAPPGARSWGRPGGARPPAGARSATPGGRRPRRARRR